MSYRQSYLPLALAVAVAFSGASPISAEPDANPCAQGYVHRRASPSDSVCVTPAARAMAAQENAESGSHREPNGGAYGPNTCLPGYVWREAFPGDVTCVTPESRARVARENREGPGFVAGNTPRQPIGTMTPPNGFDVPVNTPGIGPGSFQADRIDAGLYRLRSVLSGLCIGWQDRENGTRFLSATPCGTQGPLFAVIRESTQAEQAVNPLFSLRPIANRTNVNQFPNGSDCAGEARGVVIGPAAVDVNPCGHPDGPPPGDYCTRTRPYFGQGFSFEHVTNAPRIYRLHRFASNRCVTLRGSGTDEGTEHIVWDCHAAGSDDYEDQLFEMIPVAALPPRLAACSKN